MQFFLFYGMTDRRGCFKLLSLFKFKAEKEFNRKEYPSYFED